MSRHPGQNVRTGPLPAVSRYGRRMPARAPRGESPPERDYLTPGEAARILHVSPKTVNRWADDGRIACIVTLGGHRRFRREDIEAVAEIMQGHAGLTD